MLGRKTYTQAEFDHAELAVAEQVAAYDKLVRAVEVSADPRATASLATFEPLFFNNMVLVLDRFFVHRVRLVAGKDGNALNEVELVAEGLMADGLMPDSTVIKLVPAQSVLQLQVGQPITLGAEQFAALAKAFFAELHSRFL